jgi:hypothetical protein
MILEKCNKQRNQTQVTKMRNGTTGGRGVEARILGGLFKGPFFHVDAQNLSKWTTALDSKSPQNLSMWTHSGTTACGTT